VRRSRFFRWGLVAIVTLAGLVAAATVAVSTHWFRDWLRRQVIVKSAGVINGELRIGALSGSLWRDVELDDVTVLQGGEPTLHVAKVVAKYDAWQIALGHLGVDEIVLTDPQATIVEREDGWNITHLLRTRERGPDEAPRSIALRHLRVIGGAITVGRRGRPTDELRDLAADGSLNIDADALVARVDRLTLRDVRTGIVVQNGSATIRSSDDGLAFEDMQVATTGSQASGTLVYRGRADAPSLKVDVDAPRLSLLELQPLLPEGVPGDLVLSGSAHLDGPLTATHAVATVASSAGAIDVRATGNLTDFRERIRGELTVDRLDLAALTRRPDLRSRLTAHATFDARLDPDEWARSRVAFDLTANEAALVGYRARRVRARGVYASSSLELNASGVAYGAAASFAGTISHLAAGRSPAVDGEGNVSHLDVRALPSSLRPIDLATDITGRYQVTFDRDAWRVSLRAAESRIDTATILDGATATVATHGDRLAVEFSGDVRDVPASLLRIPATRPTSFGGTLRTAFELPRRTGAGFDVASIEGAAFASLAGSTVEGAALDRADVDVSMSGGRLDVRNLTLRTNGIDLCATGALTLGDRASGTSDLTYVLDVADLTVLQSYGVTGLSGAAHANGRITGPFDRLTTAGMLNADRIKYGDTVDALALTSSFTATLRSRAGTFTLDDLTATVDGVSTFVTIKGQEIQRLAIKSTYAADHIDVTARIEQPNRTLDADGTLIVRPDLHEVRLRQFTLAAAGEPWRLASDGDAVIQYNAREVRIENLVLGRSSERVAAAGLVALEADATRSDVTVQATGVQLADLFTLLEGAPRVTGLANADVRLTGALAAPSIKGKIEVTNGDVRGVAFSRAAADVALANKRVSIDGRVDQPNGISLTVNGEAPLATDAGDFDLRVATPGIDLGLAQAFTQELDRVHGAAAANLHITGPMSGVSLTGDLAISNGGFLVVPTGVAYESLNARLSLAGHRATIAELSLTDDDGHPLTVKGGADVFSGEAPRVLDISIETDQLHLVHNDLGELAITGTARAQGELTAPQVTGDLTIHRGRVELDSVLRWLSTGTRVVSTIPPDAPIDLEKLNAPPAPAATPPADSAIVERSAPESDTGLFSRSSLALVLHFPDNVIVRGRNVRTGAGTTALGDMNLTIGGEVEIRKSAGTTPVLIGSLEVVRGYYSFQGRRFDVARGSTVEFRGVQPINPRLDITGQRDVSGVIAEVHVQGTMRRPRLALSSQPPLDEADILSLIVFNEPINSLGEGEQAALLERAGNIALGAVATSLADSIGRALDVDLFEIRPSLSGEASTVDIGRQVNERLFVGFRQEFGQGDASRLSFEYRLTEALRVLTTFSQGADRSKRVRDRETAGIDLMFFIRY
jgi:uncharacterized protein involved in outer membrane biogenesis